MVCVLPCRDFEQEMHIKSPMRYTSPDGGSDPIALEPTDQLIYRRHIHNPVWNGLMSGSGIAG